MTHLAPVAPTLALASVSLSPVPDTAAEILAVAEALQPDLAQGFQIDALRLRLEMERAFGGSDAVGAWDWKLTYEACEVALVLLLRKFGRALLARAGSSAALLPILTKVAGLLPTHTRRSEEMERFQQFSTPLPMGLGALSSRIKPIDRHMSLCGPAFTVQSSPRDNIMLQLAIHYAQPGDVIVVSAGEYEELQLPGDLEREFVLMSRSL